MTTPTRKTAISQPRISGASIARAMRDAAWVAKNGGAEERAGRFIADRSKTTQPPCDAKR